MKDCFNMDLKIWKNTVLTWVNSLNTSNKVLSFEGFQQNDFSEIFKALSLPQEKAVDFVQEIFPNYLAKEGSSKDLSEYDYLCICTLILIFVCFTNNNEMELVREKMCLILETSIQDYLTDFLVSIQEYEDVFLLSSSTIKEEIYKFSQRHGSKYLGEGDTTPIKALYMPANCNSSLSKFFQNLKRSCTKDENSTCSCNRREELRKSKELNEQLKEQEMQISILKEELKKKEVICKEYEAKLRSKTEELMEIKEEWEKESLANEEKIKKLSVSVEEKSKMESDLYDKLHNMDEMLSHMFAEKFKLGTEKTCLEKLYESALKREKDLSKALAMHVDCNLSMSNIGMPFAESLMKGRKYDNEGSSSILNESIEEGSSTEQFDQPFRNINDELYEVLKKEGEGISKKPMSEILFCLRSCFVKCCG